MAWWKRGGRDQPAADWREDPRVARMVQLKERALQLEAAGRAEQSLDDVLEGVALGRELVAAYSEPVHLQELAAMLYGLASILNRLDRAFEAVDALQESRAAYERLQATGEPGMVPLIADVRVRHAVSMSLLGWASSAVVESDLALASYRDLVAGPDGSQHLPDLIRVLGMNAGILSRSGDPDLACASADEAVRSFMANLAAFDTTPQATAYMTSLLESCRVAGRIHAARDRLQLALSADSIAVQLAQGLVEHGGDGHRWWLAAAVARHGTHLVVAGQPGTGAARIRQARAIDAAAADEELAVVQDLPAEQQRLGLSLGVALRRAAECGVDGVADVLDLATDEPCTAMVSPSQRCEPARAAERAEALGRVGLATLPAAPTEGVRICVEAHVMFALVSERGSSVPAFWAELLDGLVAAVGFGAYGGDLVTWRERIRKRGGPS